MVRLQKSVPIMVVGSIGYNGFGLGEGRELELQNFKFSTND